MSAAVAQDLQRGRRIADVASSAVRGIPSVLRGAAGAAGALLAPAGAVGRPLLRAAGTAGRFVSSSPGLQKGLIGAGLLAPILVSAQSNNANRETQQLLTSSQNPERTVVASLQNHRIKSASFFEGLGKSLAMDGPKNLAGGLMKGVGTGLVDLAAGGLGALGGAARQMMFTEPARKRVFEQALKTDPVLQDAIQHNPDTLKQLKAAFETLVRYAPSLSVDINAVRSYLREAVISGAGINYATIKQLADTEKTINDRNRGGK